MDNLLIRKLVAMAIIVTSMMMVYVSLRAETKPFEVVPAEFIERPAPKYPRSQVNKGNAGAVELSFTIDTEGKPFDIVVIRSSDKSFEQSATDAVQDYRYSAAKMGETPIQTRQNVVVYYEIEGQKNQLSRPFFKRYQKVLKLFAEETVSQLRLKKELGRISNAARSRCDHAYDALLQSHYAQKFESPEQQVETLHRAIMFDYELADDWRCFDEGVMVGVYTNLIRNLIALGRRGEAVFEFEKAQEKGLQTVASVFKDAIQGIKMQPQNSSSVSRRIEVSSRGFFIVELLSHKFSLILIQPNGEIKELKFRCKTGARGLELHEDNRYSIPETLQGCQLLAYAEPMSEILFVE